MRKAPVPGGWCGSSRPPVRRSLRHAVALLLVALLALPLLAQQTERPEELRLAMSGAFQPFSTTDDQGHLVGFDADIAREVAIRLDREPVLVQTDWAGIQAGLQSGKFDLICGSMAITEPRLETMLFSLPYYVSGAQVFARKGIESLDGIRLGVTEDSTYERFIDEHPDQFPDVTIVRYGSEAESVAALNTDKIDGFVSDRIVGGFYVKRGGAGNIVPFGDLLYEEACGIAARQDSGKLVHRVNAALFSMIQDGTYDEIYRRWVGAPADLERLLRSWANNEQIIPELGATANAQARKEAPEFAESLANMVELLGKGAVLTIILSVLTIVISILTGSLIGVGAVARAPWMSSISNGYIWVVRGTPLLVQLFISYFGIATLVNRTAGFELMGAFGAALLALIVNTTAYNAETIRGGIIAVDAGQWDAAASIGMNRKLILRRVILPQAFRDSLPSLGNNLVVLIKDTSLVGAITLIELTYAARNVVFQTGKAFTPFIVAGVFYLLIISLVTIGVRRWEKHLHRSVRQSGGSA